MRNITGRKKKTGDIKDLNMALITYSLTLSTTMNLTDLQNVFINFVYFINFKTFRDA